MVRHWTECEQVADWVVGGVWTPCEQEADWAVRRGQHVSRRLIGCCRLGCCMHSRTAADQPMDALLLCGYVQWKLKLYKKGVFYSKEINLACTRGSLSLLPIATSPFGCSHFLCNDLPLSGTDLPSQPCDTILVHQVHFYLFFRNEELHLLSGVV